MLSFLLLAAALLLPAPSIAGRLASATRQTRASSVVILGAVFCGSLVFYSVGRISIAIAAAIIAWCVSWYTKDLVAARTQRRGREGLGPAEHGGLGGAVGRQRPDRPDRAG